MSMVTLTTDFGLSDWFVGTMKGVILQIQPRAQIVDLTHQIPAGGVRAGAIALAAGCRFFARRTIHVAVVDPGVGSSRAAIAVRTKDYVFLGPDNGLLSLALAQEKVQSIRRLENKELFRPAVSHTFHGRDLFAPVAAHLGSGVAFRTVGPEQPDYTRLALPQSKLRSGALTGEVIYVDHFGNAITNIHATQLAGFDSRRVAISIGHRRSTLPLQPFYQAVPRQQPLGLIGSSGYLEIAVNSGNAARTLGCAIGTTVMVRET